MKFNSITLLILLQSLVIADIEEDLVKEVRLQTIVEKNKGLRLQPVADVCASRIVGGYLAPIESVPYQVALKQRVDSFWFTFCGGSLITYLHVLTAAHCFWDNNGKLNKNIEDVRVVAGTERTFSSKYQFLSESKRNIRHYWRHKKFDRRGLRNDIGVLEVSSQFFPSSKIRPIPLKTKLISTVTKQCVISGFGRMDNNKQSMNLRLVCIPIVNRRTCIRYYSISYAPESIICAGKRNKDSCTGDSGGALVCGGVQVGILSYGGPCGAYPAVYARVDWYTDSDLIFTDGGNRLNNRSSMIIMLILLNFIRLFHINELVPWSLCWLSYF